MDKQECLNITELLSVTWDKPIDQASLTVRAKGYWEYIGDLPYDAVKQAVKEMGLSGRRWIPRPGEVRIATMARTSARARRSMDTTPINRAKNIQWYI